MFRVIDPRRMAARGPCNSGPARPLRRLALFPVIWSRRRHCRPLAKSRMKPTASEAHAGDDVGGNRRIRHGPGRSSRDGAANSMNRAISPSIRAAIIFSRRAWPGLSVIIFPAIASGFPWRAWRIRVRRISAVRFPWSCGRCRRVTTGARSTGAAPVSSGIALNRWQLESSGNHHWVLRPVFLRPPLRAGQWNIVLMLREWTPSGFVTRDFANFDAPYVQTAPRPAAGGPTAGGPTASGPTANGSTANGSTASRPATTSGPAPLPKPEPMAKPESKTAEIKAAASDALSVDQPFHRGNPNAGQGILGKATPKSS